MSVATVITQGFGTFGNVNFVALDGYGDYGVTPPVVVAEEPRGGTSKRDKKRKSRVIRLSDLETRDQIEKEILEALHFDPIVPEVIEEEDEDEDDVLIKLLMVTLH